MRKILLLMILLVLHNSMADSIDNAMLEQMQEQKSKSKQEQQAKMQQNSQDDVPVIQDLNKTRELPPQPDTAIQESKQKKQDSNQQQSNIATQTQIQSKKITWFIGAYLGGQYQAQYDNANAQVFNVSLQGGGLYRVGIPHFIKGYIFGSYNTINQHNLFSIGGGIDYIYKIQSLSIGLLGGAYIDTPLNASILSNPDIVIDAGIAVFISAKSHIEVRFGYPIMQDSRIKRNLIIGISYRYLIY